ncbi:Hypothetical predicted protein [Mytilus galloprovincialis]|uniref:DUF5641 domain-containing protein n=1 Tax=Mytilus galloprovincialis TaxID=29158 RepID=A0A8B6DFH7_MYTGA|nr:Hypothetical predicted protein [Mytilus galloprovincialis]
MEAKMKAVRAGHKGAVTKLLRKFEDIQQSSEADYEEISTLLEAVTQKKGVLENINEKILEQTSDEDVAGEIQDSDEYMYNLEYKLRQITKLAKSVKWKHEYLTSLREYHRNIGKDNQTIKVGDVVQVYEESPRTKWNLAVIDQLNIGGDGKTRSAVIRTKNGLTSRPITKLYPLEVSENRDFTIDNNCDLNNPSTSRNLGRKAKSVAIEKLKKWTNGNNS